MTIQERSLNEKQFGSKFIAEWNNEKNLVGRFIHAVAILCISVTDSKIWQTLNYYLKSTKTNRSAKVLFIESSMALQMHSMQNTWKYAMQSCVNKGRLWKQICIKLSFIQFEEVHKSTDLLVWVRGWSANVWFSPFKNFRYQTITNNLFSLLRNWFLRRSVN